MRASRLRVNLAAAMSATLTLAALGTGTGPGLGTAAAAAKNGTVSGKVDAKLPRAGSGETTVFATNLVDGAVVGSFPVSKNGAFKVSLPSGAYTLSTVIVRAPGGGQVSTSRQPVTLMSGQRRSQIAVKPRRTKATRSALASRSYVQENGASTPGVTAFTVENFTGGTGEWAAMGRGLTAMLTSDLVMGTQCDAKVIANKEDRALAEHELDLQRSRYFDPKSRAKRNFIVSDLTVSGSITTASGGQSAAVHVTVTDARTGAVVDTIDATLHGDTVFEQEQELAKAIGERVCRRPASYDVTLAVDGRGDFATHSAVGRIDAQLSAIRSGGEPGKPATNWSGAGSLAWSGVSARSSSECAYTAEGSPTTSWSVQLAVSGEKDVKVDWSTAGGDMATLTATCPVPDNPPAVAGGQAGPALLGIAPQSATIPLGGGTIPLSGGFTAGSDGWTNTGSLVITPIWAAAAPK